MNDDPLDDAQYLTLIEEIKQDEGYSERIYRDTLGNLTCGWGHYLQEGSFVPPRICELFLDHDIANTMTGFMRIDEKLREKLNPVRQRVIYNMIFNLGLSGVLNFKKMWKAIKKEDWDKAHTEMMDSNWSQQVGRRAFRLANLMKTGEEP